MAIGSRDGQRGAISTANLIKALRLVCVWNSVRSHCRSASKACRILVAVVASGSIHSVGSHRGRRVSLPLRYLTSLSQQRECSRSFPRRPPPNIFRSTPSPFLMTEFLSALNPLRLAWLHQRRSSATSFSISALRPASIAPPQHARSLAALTGQALCTRRSLASTTPNCQYLRRFVS